MHCAHCGNQNPPQANFCASCGQGIGVAVAVAGADVALPATLVPDIDSESANAPFPLFPLSTRKFVVMSLTTFNVYSIYWFYQHWKRLQDNGAVIGIRPFWRAAFGPLFSFLLFTQIRDAAIAEQVEVGWSPGWLAAVVIGLNAAWRAPDPWWLLGIAGVVPLFFVQRTVERVNDTFASRESPNRTYSAGNVIAIIAGVVWWLLVIAGLLLPNRIHS